MENRAAPRMLVGPGGAFIQPDPILGWKLRPGAQLRAEFRPDVLHTVGDDGWRVVPKSPAGDGPRLVFYGCSFTFGTGLADDETFPSLIQASLPGIRVQNRGVAGYSDVQSFLQFRDDVRNNAVDVAVFGALAIHRYRNVPHPIRMKRYLKHHWYSLGVEHVPFVGIERDGSVAIKHLPIWQPSLLRDDFESFLPDEYMIDVATVKMFEAILSLADANNIPTTIALLDQTDAAFNELMVRQFTQVVDVSVPQDLEHSFLPADGHPNPYANELYASRLLPTLTAICHRVGAA